MAYLDYFERFDFRRAVVYQNSISAYQKHFVVVIIERVTFVLKMTYKRQSYLLVFIKMRSGEFKHV